MKQELFDAISKNPVIFDLNSRDPHAQLKFLRKIILDTDQKPTGLFDLFLVRNKLEKHIKDIPELDLAAKAIESNIIKTYSSSAEDYIVQVIEKTMPYLDWAPIRPVVQECLENEVIYVNDIMNYLRANNIDCVYSFMQESKRHDISIAPVMTRILKLIIERRKAWG